MLPFRITVEPVAFFFIFTIYIEFTAVQDIVYARECYSLHKTEVNISTLCLKSSSPSNGSQTINKDEVSKLTALEMKYYMSIFSLCALISSFWTGSWSDYYGRKLIMILPSLIGILAEICFIVASLNLIDVNLKYLIYLASVFNGISGGSTTVISSCFGYMADVTSTDERSKRITYLESALFVGGFLGYNLAGLMIKYVIGDNYYIIFVLCVILHSMLIFYVYYFVPETRFYGSSSNFSSVISLDHARRMFQVIFRERISRKAILLLCCCAICSSLTLSVQLTLTYSFLKRSPLNWDTYLYTLYNSFNFLLSGIALIVILPLIYHKFGSKDALISALGFASKAIGLINFGLSQTTTQMFVTILLLSMSEFTMPAIRSMMSKLVSSDERAKAYSFLGLLQNLISLIGSFLFPTIFALTIPFFPGFVFQVTAIVQLIAFLILLFMHFKMDMDSLTHKMDTE